MRPDSGYYPELILTHEIEDDLGRKSTISYQVYTTQTRCNFGGERLWFMCPLGKCRRRVGVLYFSGKYFGCRQCVGYEYDSKSLNYESSSAGFIALISAQQLEEKTKRYTWRGKDTRKMRRIRKLYERAGYPRIPDMLIGLRARDRGTVRLR